MIINIGLFVTVFRVVVTAIVIAFVTPQISITYYDYVITTLHSSGIFYTYPDVRKFVTQFTRLCIVSYLLINILLSF